MDFIDLAHQCAPNIVIEDIAAITEVQSRFNPLIIRVNSVAALKQQPDNIEDAINIATQLIASGEDIEMGLTGVDIQALNKTGLGIKDAFDPCTNLKITAKLLEEYAATSSHEGNQRTVMLSKFYGRGNYDLGFLAGYEKVIDQTIERLNSKIDTIQVQYNSRNLLNREWTGDKVSIATDDADTKNKLPYTPKKQVSDTASWDVFGQSKNRSNIFFSDEN